MVSPVPPEIRKFLPLIALALFAVLILPSILKGKKSSGTTSASVRAADTTAALKLIDTESGRTRRRTAAIQSASQTS